MKHLLSLLIGLLFLKPVAAEPYSELANLPAQTSIAMGFEFEPSLISHFFQTDRDDLDLRSMTAVLWKQLKQQEKFSGWVTLTGEGYVFEILVDQPQVLADKVKSFVDKKYDWNPDGAGFKTYRTRLDIDLESSRLRYGDIQGVETIESSEKKLSDLEAYQTLPEEKRSKDYILYFRPDLLLIAPLGLREQVKDQPDKLAIIDKVFGHTPSYPDIAIVGTPEGSEMVVWESKALEGFSAANESAKAFRQEYNLTLSMPERIYFHLIVPPMDEMLENLSSTSPKVTTAAPFWLGVQELMKDMQR